MGYVGGLHFWWPKITGRLYPEFLARTAAVILFVGFNLTFFPQFILGGLGMPRRYHNYPPEFQVLNVMSTAGASILALGYLLPMIYLTWSMRYGKIAGPNPWPATGLEWKTASPPLTENFHETPVVVGSLTTRSPSGFGPHRLEAESAGKAFARARRRLSFRSGRIFRSVNRWSSNHRNLLKEHRVHRTGELFGQYKTLDSRRKPPRSHVDLPGYGNSVFRRRFLTYTINRHQFPTAFGIGGNMLSLKLGGANTVVLIASSFTMAMSVWSAQTSKKQLVTIFLILTLILGTIFLGVKVVEYRDKFVHHLIPGHSFDVTYCTKNPVVCDLSGKDLDDEKKEIKEGIETEGGVTALNAHAQLYSLSISA